MFPKIGVPQNGWFIMENPIKSIKMDDLGVPLFLETPSIASSYFQAEFSICDKKKHHHFSSDFHGMFFFPTGARPRDQQQDVQHKPRYDGRITPPE